MALIAAIAGATALIAALAPTSAIADDAANPTLGVASDGQAVRLGFDGMIRFGAFRRDRGPASPRDASHLTPSGAGLQFGAMQEVGASDPASATFASLRARFDGRSSSPWLGIGSRIATGDAQLSSRLHFGAGWQPRLPAIQMEFAAFASPVTVGGGLTRPVLHAVGRGGRDSTYLGELERVPDHQAVWTSVQTTLRWTRGRAEVATIAGVTVGAFTTPQRWALAQARYRLSPKLSLSLAAGRASPVALAFDPRSAPRTQIGLEFAPLARPTPGATEFRPVPRKWSAQSVGQGRAAIHVQCHDAMRLRIRGDFTDWQEMEMQRIGGAWWELVVAAEPGLHRVQLRIDNGRWDAPPGLPLSATDTDEPAGALLIQ